MEKPTHRHITDALQMLALDVFDGIAQAVYVGNRPSAGKERDTFIVLRTSGRVGEHNVYQQLGLYVEIYVRNMQNGIPNLRKLQEIEDKVLEKFPLTYETPDYLKTSKWRWRATNPLLQITGDDQLGFTAWLVRASLQINTSDRFHV